MPNRMQTFDSNGPSVKIRGNAYQVFERYVALAREAATSGDRVAAENLYQHAEHYFRVMNANGEGQGQQGGVPRPMTPADTEMTGADGEMGEQESGSQQGYSGGQQGYSGGQQGYSGGQQGYSGGQQGYSGGQQGYSGGQSGQGGGQHGNSPAQPAQTQEPTPSNPPMATPPADPYAN